MIFEMILDNWGDWEAFQSQAWMWMVTKGLFNLGIGVVTTKGLFNLDLSYGDQGAFQPWSWRKGTNELFNLGIEAITTKGHFNLYFELWHPRDFPTSILNYDNQRAFQSWSWRKETKRLFNLGTRAVATKGLFNLDLEEKVTKGFFNLGTGFVVTKVLFNLDLEEREPRGFSTLEPELWRPRGFSTSILKKGNQGAFQPWN